MVPGPESNSNRELPVCIRTEHELRFSDGTQVPEPKIVTFIPVLSAVISNSIFGANTNKGELLVIRSTHLTAAALRNNQ